ncbi:LysR family transcriptional regulator [Burkholderia sp. Bp9143]|uniref:LysR family transcriptional regulator n=1 Tax=Burkholderia sp. Bp9143 TaxID=2184574 RepID=UPI000F5A76CC|nr:LysR family transcriptional regulator [Burkholderia sp. Bp9143]RQR34423.1 LysR family transcriptional regulator [Burkholderia sp. Bp9143]
MTEQIGLDRLTSIIAFARAASLGSYTAAARSLSISPSAVSKSVQRLEERLGVRLFTRTTRALTLTSEGQDLLERALRLLNEAESFEQGAMAARADPAGVLKVTAPIPIGVRLIAPNLPRFRERFPQVTVDLRLSDAFVDLVEEGIDVAIRIGASVDSPFIGRRLAANTVCAFASPSYLERRGVPMCPEELEGHDCVNVRVHNSGQPLKWPFRIGKRLLEVLPDAKLIVDSADAVAAIIANGGGIGISPTYIAAAFVARGELVPVLADYRVDRNHVTALWPESRRSNPSVKAFVAFLGEIFTDPTPWNEAIFGESVN